MARLQEWDNFTAFCESYKKNSSGRFDNQRRDHILPISRISLSHCHRYFSHVIFPAILKPFGQAGIALGPSFLERNEKFSKKMFSPKVSTVLNVFDTFGLFYMLFLLSVRVYISIVKKAGRLAIFKGIGSFLLPFMEGPMIARLLRMADNTSIMLTIIRFIAMNNHSTNDLMEEKQDSNMISEFRRNNIDNKNVKYIKRSVKEGADTAAYMLHAIADDFDLILAGRRHDNNSQVLIGLSEWNEVEDLGVIGDDILVSSDFHNKASVMVIQQQASVMVKEDKKH